METVFIKGRYTDIKSGDASGFGFGIYFLANPCGFAV
jgi:hypothetical protein